jgi:hypothetical protein
VSDPVLKVEAAFVADPFGTLTWTDITSYVNRQAGVSFQRGRQHSLQRSQAGTLTLRLANTDGRFDPGNASSPYYPYVQVNTPIRVSGLIGGTPYRRWRGFVERWTQTWVFGDNIAWVDVTAVDGFKPVLGVTFSDPYDVKFRKDYNIYTGQSGEASLTWNYWTYSAALPADGGSFAATYGSGSQSQVRRGSMSKLSSGTVSGDGVSVAAGAVLQATTNSYLELWLKLPSAPTLSGTGAGACLMGSENSQNVVTSAKTHLLPTLPTNETSLSSFLRADNKTIAVEWYGQQNGTTRGHQNTMLYYYTSLVNAFPSENAATFQTDTSAWTYHSVSATRQTATKPLVWNSPAASNCKLTVTSTDEPWALSPRYTVDPTKKLCLSFAFSTTGSSNYNVNIEWYDSTDTFISRDNSGGVPQLPAATSIGAYIVRINEDGGSTPAIPSNAAYGRIRIGRYPGQGLGGTVNDTITVTGFMLVHGVDAPANTHAIFTGGVAPNSEGPPHYEPVGQASTSYFVAVIPRSTTGVGGARAFRWPTASAPITADGDWHLIGLTDDSAATNVVLAVDGLDRTTGANVAPVVDTDAYNGNSTRSTGCTIGGLRTSTGTILFPMNGVYVDEWYSVSNAPTNVNPITVSTVLGHYNYAISGTGSPTPQDFPSQTTSERVTAILDTIGWPAADRSIDAGGVTLSATGSVSGTSALELLQQAADAEYGNVFIDGSGTFVFHARDHISDYTPTLTFGDTGSDVRYLGDITVDYDDTNLYNDIQITREGSSPTYVAYARDATSQVSYGQRALTKSYPYAADATADTLATRLLADYKNPQRRIDKVSTQVKGNADAASVFGLEIGEPSRVKRDPKNALIVQIDTVVEGVAETIGETTWVVTFQHQPKPASA